ncbi:putative DNA binding domain-containing protein [Erysipelotrichaceae bacterium RD49]|nr:putative DNA binding domain-containing protein [Erysipelotrichaceae bacterium RD49]
MADKKQFRFGQQVSDEELEQTLLHLKEDCQTEIKEAKQLPKSFWETYSSFSNTDGGDVVLGVREDSPVNELVGLSNTNQVLKDLWNGLSNPNKVNIRILQNSDVITRKIGDKEFVFIRVPEAHFHQKPIYLNGKLDNTYIRTGDGDRKATNNEVATMMRNQSRNADSQVAKGMGIADLDPLTLAKFKNVINSRYPAQHFATFTDEEFLIRLGGAVRNRESGEFELFTGTILLLGKTNVISELFPHFHLDYFEFDPSSENRWTFRISDNDYLIEEINLFSFFEKVLNRISAIVKEPFGLDDNIVRKPDGGVTLRALREALVNSLIHSDYQIADSSVRIEVRQGQFTFKNPGQMLIPEDSFFVGGHSVVRNEVLMKLFSAAGFSERQGFGGSQIFSSSSARDYKLPEIKTSLTQTELLFWTEPAHQTEQVQNDYERFVLNIFKENANIRYSFSQLKEKTHLGEYRLRKTLNKLQQKQQIEMQGAGRGTTYGLLEN